MLRMGHRERGSEVMSPCLDFTELKANPKEVPEGNWISGLSREGLVEVTRKGVFLKVSLWRTGVIG